MRTALKCLCQCMPLDQAALILTLTDEPELILQPGEAAPIVPPLFIRAARILSRLEGRKMRANRIEIKWRAPLDPKVYGYGRRLDPGGYVYRLFRGGRLAVSGTGRDLNDVRTHTLRRAAELGMTAPLTFIA